MESESQISGSIESKPRDLVSKSSRETSPSSSTSFRNAPLLSPSEEQASFTLSAQTTVAAPACPLTPDLYKDEQLKQKSAQIESLQRELEVWQDAYRDAQSKHTDTVRKLVEEWDARERELRATSSAAAAAIPLSGGDHQSGGSGSGSLNDLRHAQGILQKISTAIISAGQAVTQAQEQRVGGDRDVVDAESLALAVEVFLERMGDEFDLPQVLAMAMSPQYEDLAKDVQRITALISQERLALISELRALQHENSELADQIDQMREIHEIQTTASKEHHNHNHDDNESHYNSQEEEREEGGENSTAPPPRAVDLSLVSTLESQFQALQKELETKRSETEVKSLEMEEKNRNLLIKLCEVEAANRALTQDLAHRDSKIEDLKTKCEKLDMNFLEAQKSAQQLMSLQQSGTCTRQDCKNETSKLRAEIADAKSKAAELLKEIEHLKAASAGGSQAECLELRQRVEGMQKEHMKERDELLALVEQVTTELRNALSSRPAEQAALQQQISDLQGEVRQKEVIISDLQSRLNGLTHALEKERERAEIEERQNVENEQNSKDASAEVKRLQHDVSRLIKERKKLTTLAHGIQSENKSLREFLCSLCSQLQALLLLFKESSTPEKENLPEGEEEENQNAADSMSVETQVQNLVDKLSVCIENVHNEWSATRKKLTDVVRDHQEISERLERTNERFSQQEREGKVMSERQQTLERQLNQMKQTHSDQVSGLQNQVRVLQDRLTTLPSIIRDECNAEAHSLLNTVKEKQSEDVQKMQNTISTLQLDNTLLQQKCQTLEQQLSSAVAVQSVPLPLPPLRAERTFEVPAGSFGGGVQSSAQPQPSFFGNVTNAVGGNRSRSISPPIRLQADQMFSGDSLSGSGGGRSSSLQNMYSENFSQVQTRRDVMESELKLLHEKLTSVLQRNSQLENLVAFAEGARGSGGDQSTSGKSTSTQPSLYFSQSSRGREPQLQRFNGGGEDLAQKCQATKELVDREISRQEQLERTLTTLGQERDQVAPLPSQYFAMDQPELPTTTTTQSRDKQPTKTKPKTKKSTKLQSESTTDMQGSLQLQFDPAMLQKLLSMSTQKESTDSPPKKKSGKTKPRSASSEPRKGSGSTSTTPRKRSKSPGPAREKMATVSISGRSSVTSEHRTTATPKKTGKRANSKARDPVK